MVACVQVNTFNQSMEKLEPLNCQLFGGGGKGTVFFTERVIGLLSSFVANT